MSLILLFCSWGKKKTKHIWVTDGRKMKRRHFRVKISRDVQRWFQTSDRTLEMYLLRSRLKETMILWQKEAALCSLWSPPKVDETVNKVTMTARGFFFLPSTLKNIEALTGGGQSQSQKESKVVPNCKSNLGGALDLGRCCPKEEEEFRCRKDELWRYWRGGRRRRTWFLWSRYRWNVGGTRSGYFQLPRLPRHKAFALCKICFQESWKLRNTFETPSLEELAAARKPGETFTGGLFWKKRHSIVTLNK